MSNPYEFGRVGRYASVYLPEEGAVELRDIERDVLVRKEFHDMELPEVLELIENEVGEVGHLTTDELIFVMNYASCIEQNCELAPHDIHEFGHVGVSG